MMRQRAVMVGILVAALCIVNTMHAYGAIGDYKGQWGDGQFEGYMSPAGVAVAPNGDVYVTEYGSNRVQYFGPTGQYKGQWGEKGSGAGQFSGPAGIAVAPNGDVYVADWGNNRIQYFTPTGVFRGEWGSLGGEDGKFNGPNYIAVAPNGDVYVVCNSQSRVQYFTPTGEFKGTWGTDGFSEGQFNLPRGVAVAPNGDVYVVDYGWNRVQYFDAIGTFKGMWGRAGSGEGELNEPAGVAVGSDGRVYVSEVGTHRIQYFSPVGEHWGMWGSRGSGDGQMDSPYRIAVAPNGDVYVADSGNKRIQYFAGVRTPATLSTVAGDDRYHTAVEASKAGYPDGASDVVIATGENWPDALGGSALAGVVDGPLLLVRARTIPEVTRAEIRRLNPRTIYVLGGSGAIESVVVAELRAMPGNVGVLQLAGPTRYEAAAKILEEVIEHGGFDGLALIARGDNYPDALAASPLAAAWRAPIILARPGDAPPPLPAQARRVIILGEVDVVSAEIENALKASLGKSNVTRLGGATRYDTAALIARAGVAGGLSWNGVGITTGENFPDALAGGVLQGKRGSVMLLTRTNELSPAADAVLAANRDSIREVTFYGSTVAVGPAVRTAVAQLLE